MPKIKSSHSKDSMEKIPGLKKTSLNTENKDILFSLKNYPKPFEFNEDVANVFDDMVLRSIPLYETVLESAVQWAHFFYQPGTSILDIGCSTGTTLAYIGEYFRQLDGSESNSPIDHRPIDNPKPKLIGIEPSNAMVAKAQQKLAPLKKWVDVELVRQKAPNFAINNCSVVYLNYTLQFIPVNTRLQLLKKIYDGLTDNGVLFISEKLRSDFLGIQEAKTLIYEQFKERNGYSKNEIERKKEALDQVLVPTTEPELIEFLKLAGFEKIDTVHKWNQFTTIVAIK